MKKKVIIIFILFLLVIFLFAGKLSPKDEISDGTFSRGEEKKAEVESSVANRSPDNLARIKAMDKMVIKSEEEIAGVQKEKIKIDVPFASQAPFGDWDDPLQQDACEEVAALMAVSWGRGERAIDADAVVAEIEKISAYELEHLGTYVDTSASSTMEFIFQGYFSYDNVELVYDVEFSDIIKELKAGNIIVAPFNGRRLNIYYSPPGPARHMLVIVGYDYNREEFITNDPGTRRGKFYYYKKDILLEAMRDYPTGNNEPIVEERRAMIVVSSE